MNIDIIEIISNQTSEVIYVQVSGVVPLLFFKKNVLLVTQ